jgi:hypothetical protein
VVFLESKKVSLNFGWNLNQNGKKFLDRLESPKPMLKKAKNETN